MFMKKVSAFIVNGMMLATLVATSPMALAQAGLPGNPQAELDKVKTGAGFTATTDLPTVIGRVINVLFSLLGLIAVVIVVYSGFQWMTSGGDEKKIGAAKSRMINAVIGIAIILLAYSITSFVLSKLATVTAG